MENRSECVEPKTPKRTRRSSTIQFESATKRTRSLKSNKLTEIEETADAPTEPKTPRKSVKQPEFQTPSKSEATTSTETPRRSVRKSIKPVQEYENIVAKKGLKRAASTALDEEHLANEGKWVPAVIGRVSMKRGKKSGRGKSKNLKRQRRLTEESEDKNDVDSEPCEVNEEELLDENKDDEIIQGEVLDKQLETKVEEGSVNLLQEESANKKETEIEKVSLKLLPEESVDKKKKTEIEEASLENESVLEKERIDSEHAPNHYVGDKSDKEIDDNESVKNHAEKEVIESGHVLKENEPVVETNIDSGVEYQSDVSKTKLDLDKTHSREEIPSANANEGEDSDMKDLSTEDKISEDVHESADNKQTDDVKEKEIERGEKCIEIAIDEPAIQIENLDEVEEESVESLNTSTEDGDVEFVGMPITADDDDDAMESPKKGAHSPLAAESLNLKSQSPRDLGDGNAENADDSDCIMLSLNDSSNTVKSENGSEEPAKGNKLLDDSTNSTTEMPSLLVCSDDEEEQTKASEVAEKAPEPDESSQLNTTFDAAESIEKSLAMVPQTPVLRPSISHVPTPFKSKTPMIPDIIIEPEDESQNEEPPTVVEETKETRIKSARKRSFSVCVDRPKRNVRFHSPANTTVSIYDGDLMDSCRKADSSTAANHRKRSLSVTETEKEMFAYIKQKKIPDTPESKKKSASRIKMPNFSAIHQQQFQRMESISDHVARKAERAKILTNSALKAKPASVQKGLPVKNSVLRDSNKDAKTNPAMPKARQRIELSGIELKPKPEQTGWLNVGMKMRTKSRNDLSALDDLPSLDKLYKFNTTSLALPSNPKLPKPRMDATVSSTSKTLPPPTSKRAKSDETLNNQTTKPDLRPKFNLSTASQSFRSTETLSDRRNRLMDMYKSRNQPRPRDKNREILKGVRKNRRFELQMMCRNRPK